MLSSICLYTAVNLYLIDICACFCLALPLPDCVTLKIIIDDCLLSTSIEEKKKKMEQRTINRTTEVIVKPFLGLLAKIECSICSYQFNV